MSTPLFSIVIPVYCGGDCAEAILDNIISQGLPPSDYEVIFIDDASPDNSAALINKAITDHPQCQARMLARKENGRQGAARNNGIEIATGQYVLFLDHDDLFLTGALKALKEAISNIGEYPDIVTFDYHEARNGEVTPRLSFGGNSQEMLSGREYMIKCAIPWTPWEYAYSLEFLRRENLRFEENVRMEDSDFVMRCTLAARKITYRPIPVVRHAVYDGQTSSIGNDVVKIEDMFKNSDRVGQIALKQMPIDRESADVVVAQYRFKRKTCVLRYLWRLRHYDIYRLLKKYPSAPEISDSFNSFISCHPRLTAIALSAAKPFLLAAWRAKRVIG
ncbi:MAG: glycosyltransferase [Bacteroides sp.]|nr:glycosyltransferase [Bacteroides sp.]MCM1457409.1 glycosyltransferase [Lachnoclostridium sp.]